MNSSSRKLLDRQETSGSEKGGYSLPGEDMLGEVENTPQKDARSKSSRFQETK